MKADAQHQGDHCIKLSTHATPLKRRETYTEIKKMCLIHWIAEKKEITKHINM